MPDHDVWKWVGAVFATMCAFLLKHFHGKITEAVSKAELADALRMVAVQRAEDMIRADDFRKERRQTETAIFEHLHKQDALLARIDERTALMTSGK